MGQSSTGGALYTGTGATPSYTNTKSKKRETLTLKHVRIRKAQKKQSHFQSSVDFSQKTQALNHSPAVSDEFGLSEIPVLTAAVAPVASVATDSTYNIVADTIPVLEKTVSPVNSSSGNQKLLTAAGVALLLFSFGLLGLNHSTEESEPGELLLDTSINNTEHQHSGAYSEKPGATGTNSEFVTTKNATQTDVVTKSEILLVQNVVGLLTKEQFTQETTINAFLNVWQPLNNATKTSLNSTPWFLRFVFSLQKKTRTYLQSPDSYDANYNIKPNGLLKLAVAVGVMDQKGIQSRVEVYSSKRNELVEQLKSEIATIETETKNSTPKNIPINQYKERFRKRFELKPQKTEVIKPRGSISETVDEKNTVNDKNGTIIENVAKDRLSKAETIVNNSPVPAVELDSLITRFVTAYEHGDLNMLESLFAPTAKTNDKTNLAGIRKDYQQLFDGSSFRILNLMNLHWSSHQNYMKGTGDYEIAIAMDEAGNARTLHGKIQFVVAKVDNNLRITRLYHLER